MNDTGATGLPSPLGHEGTDICAAVEAARDFLQNSGTAALLGRVGQVVEEIPPTAPLDKRFFQRSFRGDVSGPPDDLLTGLGVFYVTEQRKLYLDCTSGHYQMTWGYNHPELNAAVVHALQMGIVWDDHSNIPGHAVKKLSVRLVEVANGLPPGQLDGLEGDEGLNTVAPGGCTGPGAGGGAAK